MSERSTIRYAAYPGPICPSCKRPIEHGELVSGEQSCPSCRRSFEAARFDPPVQRVKVVELARLGPKGGTACARHPRNASEGTCTRCGVFMCALCSTELDDEATCPACLDRRVEDGSLSRTERDWNALALLAGVAGPFSLGLLAPVSIALAIKGLRQARELNGGYVGSVLALLLGTFSALVGVAMLSDLLT